MKSCVVREGGYNVIYIMENELQNEIKKLRSECICNFVHSRVNPTGGMVAANVSLY